MANRYWVGGTAAWDGTAGTKWALTSGGAGGQAVPTAADDVFFDGASGTVTCTISGSRVAQSIDSTGFTGTIAGTATPALTLSGSLNFAAGTTLTYTGTTTFIATGTVRTAPLTMGPIVVNGSGITVTLNNALTSSGSITVTQGTFTTNNFVVQATSLSSSNNNTRTINLGSSTVTLTSATAPVILTTSTNLTFNAGTSTIVCSGAPTGQQFEGGGRTFYDVSFTSASTGSYTIAGANSFRNLSFTGLTSSGLRTIDLSADQTITGTLTLSAGTDATMRQFVRSGTLGTVRTLTVAAFSGTDVDFRDITISGAAAPVSGTRLGDCKGNSGITFPVAKTVYWNLAGSNVWSATAWATSAGGGVAANNFPLAQDTAVFTSTSPGTGTTTTINANWSLGTVDLSARTANTMTLANGTNAPTFYGNFINGTGITLSGTGAFTFSGRTTQTITSAGKTYTQNLTVNSPGGTVRLLDACTSGITNPFALTQGTLDLNGNTLSSGTFTSSGSTTRAITFGSANIALTSTTAAATVLSMANAANFTMTTSGGGFTRNQAAGATINFGGSGGGTASNAPNLSITAGASNLTLSNGSVFKNLVFTGSTCTVTANNLSVAGNLTLATGGTYTSVVPTFIASGTLTSNGRTLGNTTVNGSGITVTLADAANCPTLTLTEGTLDLAGFTYTASTSATTAAGTKNLTFNGGTLVCSAASATAWNNANPTNFTTTAGTGTGIISMTAATAKTFVGGGSTYNCTLRQGGAGALTISGSNTFNNIDNSTQPATVTFTAGTTQTVSNFSLSGTAGNLITIDSTSAGSQFTLSKSSGTVTVNYLSIQDSNATGGAVWNAYSGIGNVNAGNNTGWLFTAPSAGGFLMFM